ncbi:hypothetical protein B0H11DRAFT_1646824, partial [Mycena galericulata]
VPVLCASANPQDSRFPYVESVMGDADVQPYVHDVAVFLMHRDANGRLKGSTFRVFFKRHKRLSFNCRFTVQGDILI